MDYKDIFRKDGYIIFNINDNDLIDRVNNDIDELLKSDSVKTNSKIYSYNDAPRIVESHKRSDNCLNLAKHHRVMEMIGLVTGESPRPFSTINFVRSTQQPLHSDYVHFGTIPELNLVGSWVALEDIDPNSGPLHVVPGSHKYKIFEFSDVVEKMPRSRSELKKQYTLYEEWIKSELEKKGAKSIDPTLKKGDCILWSANLLHGSPECLDNTLSRKSQVTHWSFGSTESHYNPNFSNVSEGIFTPRDVSYF